MLVLDLSTLLVEAFKPSDQDYTDVQAMSDQCVRRTSRERQFHASAHTILRILASRWHRTHIAELDAEALDDESSTESPQQGARVRISMADYDSRITLTDVSATRRGEIRCPKGLAIWRSENAPILNIIYPP